jgi:hypothetical protein
MGQVFYKAIEYQFVRQEIHYWDDDGVDAQVDIVNI